MITDLRALLEGRRTETDRMQQAQGCVIPYLFTRRRTPIKSIACVALGESRARRAWAHPYDFTRTRGASRGLLRNGGLDGT